MSTTAAGDELAASWIADWGDALLSCSPGHGLIELARQGTTPPSKNLRDKLLLLGLLLFRLCLVFR